ncbi:hypothetical protein HaLaN_02909 [Haematococcus lacustris]|uniref:Uncharacterized protein n=1 Tax=Haematococcus lacustris TaxID=44745 RepID=A0A699YMF3_HAELA|nr:hypothetical protein HaLaN_02909 [Haematococcus lacustris]
MNQVITNNQVAPYKGDVCALGTHTGLSLLWRSVGAPQVDRDTGRPVSGGHGFGCQLPAVAAAVRNQLVPALAAALPAGGACTSRTGRYQIRRTIKMPGIR